MKKSYSIMKFGFLLLFLLQVSLSFASENFNYDWKFNLIKNEADYDKSFSATSVNDSDWKEVSLPHTANMEPLVVNDQWQGICWYRKDFDIANYSKEKVYIFEFEAAMNKVQVWVNGVLIKEHQGGYLPIVFDATSYLKATDNTIAVRLDNRDNPVTGPKPLKILDFNTFGGIYRNVNLITKNKLHITHPILADKVASGGVFVTTPKVSEEESEVVVKTHIVNQSNEKKTFVVTNTIYFKGKEVESSDEEYTLSAGEDKQFSDDMDVEDAKLWSPDAPNLYTLKTTISSGKEVIDSEETRFGIRSVTFVDNQIHVNGKKTYLRGVNRHQEYPYIGYALSDNAQYRDAKIIKDAGFDYIRLSHYPQSPAFMRACDELGLFVADAILGWQYYADNSAFRNFSFWQAHNLVRRDRNHPCVLAWEVSLNETQMPVEFQQKLHDIVHAEYPAKDVYTCGWMHGVYDIYFQARQHRIGHPDEMVFDDPYMVSEYGDWEYYSSNAGLNQHNHSKTKRLELSSRQFRSNGEKGMRQQAYNLEESHNDNMTIPATGDSYWVMYDYNRGYHDEIESSGICDIARLPKFGYNFYRSQRDADNKEDIELTIGSFWDAASNTDVKVYSNCNSVELFLNNKLVAKQTPDQNKNTTKLNHPSYTFKVGKFEPGTLKAVGYIGGKKVATTEVTTPGEPVALKCWVGEYGKAPEAGCNDVVFVYVAAVDKNGTICHNFTDKINVDCDSKVEIMNTDGVYTEAGIAPALLRIGNESGSSKISVTSGDLKGKFTLKIK